MVYDGLGIFRNTSGSNAERKRKNIIKLFKAYDLSITCEINLKVVDFLDVRFDLTKGTFEPYRKPNNDPVYIDKNSNHPPNIIHEIPISINKRLAEISSDEKVFNRNVKPYREALHKSGFEHKLKYVKHNENNDEEKKKKKSRKRKIIWNNPPFSMNVKTNIGKCFFKLLKKHFPHNHIFHQIFNKNKVKISYSCFPNMNSIISSHNKNIIKPSTITSGCNCTNKRCMSCTK